MTERKWVPVDNPGPFKQKTYQPLLGDEIRNIRLIVEDVAKEIVTRIDLRSYDAAIKAVESLHSFFHTYSKTKDLMAFITYNEMLESIFMTYSYESDGVTGHIMQLIKNADKQLAKLNG